MRIDFEEYIDGLLRNMTGNYIDLVSGDIHRAVGGYPSSNHRMPVCCDVMYSRMRKNDVVLSAPPKGKGATLRIRYYNQNRANIVRTRQDNVSIRTDDASMFWGKVINALANTPYNIRTIDKDGNTGGGKWFIASFDGCHIKIDGSQKQPSSRLANSRFISREEFTKLYPNYYKWRTGVIPRELAKGDSLNSSYIFALINAFDAATL